MKIFPKIKKSLKHSLKVKITNSILRAPSLFKHNLANKVQEVHREFIPTKLTKLQRLKMFFFHRNDFEEYKFSRIRRLFLNSYDELTIMAYGRDSVNNKTKAMKGINKIFPLIEY